MTVIRHVINGGRIRKLIQKSCIGGSPGHLAIKVGQLTHTLNIVGLKHISDAKKALF